MRRPKPAGPHGDLEIDLDTHLIVRNGKEVRLTKTGGGCWRHSPSTWGSSRRIAGCWSACGGPGYSGDIDVLRVFISQLRRKFEPDPARPTIIATDPGIGYR